MDIKQVTASATAKHCLDTANVYQCFITPDFLTSHARKMAWYRLFVPPWKYQTQVVTPDGHVSTDVPEVLDVAGQVQVLLVLLVW